MPEVEARSVRDANEEERAHKRPRLENGDPPQPLSERKHGIAPIKKEYLIDAKFIIPDASTAADDDAAEAAGKDGEQASRGERGAKKAKGKNKNKNKGGANHARKFGREADAIQLCKTRIHAREFDPITCSYGDKCKGLHDIRDYLQRGKRGDLEAFDKCPALEVRGYCWAGWKCRFAKAHSEEVTRDDGRKELVLTLVKENSDANGDATSNGTGAADDADADDGEPISSDIKNVVSRQDKLLLRSKKFPMSEANAYVDWLEDRIAKEDVLRSLPAMVGDVRCNKAEIRASWTESPLKPSEKRRLYYGPETPILAPLTTQGNLPFRRLCVSLGAEVTWSEMAMGRELLSGTHPEWALVKAHESEMSPPKYTSTAPVVGYDNAKDLRFGVQISAPKPWVAIKATHLLTTLAPNIRAIDLNCGCPIDLVFNQGGGAALMDSQLKLERMLRGMNVVSKEVPVTVKIRMGTKDKVPTAEKLCKRLILGVDEGPAGVAAITLHGRSRQQRYTRSADWSYIADCAALVKKLQRGQDDVVDTVREPDARDLPVTNSRAGPGLPYFIGNGDILSHVDWNEHMEKANVDSCMIGRGALIKPWIFEEIAQGQYLDKSGSERYEMIRQFVRNGLEYWGSDEKGVGNTRRFLLEWLSFSCRYVPVGILEHLPPRLGDRPPAFKGRDDRETLLSSANSKDWIKISEQFLGPPTSEFRFEPKHKSNSYEMEAQG